MSQWPTPAHIARLRALAARAHRQSIVLRRDDVALPGQPGMLVMRGTATWARRPEARAADPGTAGLLFGRVDMDVQQGDRLTAGGAVYEVVMVQPERDVETVCRLEGRQ